MIFSDGCRDAYATPLKKEGIPQGRMASP